MRVGSAEVGVPRVEVRVEVHERDRPVLGRDRAQQRQRDRVVAADRHDAVGLPEQSPRCRLDLAHRGDEGDLPRGEHGRGVGRRGAGGAARRDDVREL